MATDEQITQAVEILFYKKDLELEDFISLHKLASDIDLNEIISQFAKQYRKQKFASVEAAVDPIAHVVVVTEIMSGLYKEAGWGSLLKPLAGIWKGVKTIAPKAVEGAKKIPKVMSSTFSKGVDKYDKMWSKYVQPHVPDSVTRHRHLLLEGGLVTAGSAPFLLHKPKKNQQQQPGGLQ